MAADPTYRRIGDHTECIQVDFDPGRVSYEELLDVFFGMHNPARPAFSVQYASLVLAHDEAQRQAALEAVARYSALSGGPLATAVRVLDRFYVAEDYHQKYYLRQDRVLLREMESILGKDPSVLRESTAAARLNGYVAGAGSGLRLAEEIDQLGIGREAREHLAGIVGGVASNG